MLIMAEGRGRLPMLQKLAHHSFDVHANSNHVAEEFRSNFNGNLTTSYGIVNPQDFLNPPAVFDKTPSPATPDNPVRFCMLARLPSVSKGEPTARQAWSLLSDDHRSRAELHLAGYLDPPTEPPNSNIFTHSWIPHDQVPDWLAHKDVMLIPSTNESFCQSMVQAMLVGMPKLTSTLPVLTEKLDSNAAGYASDSPQQLAAQVAELIDNPSRRRSMGRAARTIALERYTFNTKRWADDVLIPSANSSKAQP